MKRVAISTLGCKTNQFESAAMIEQLKGAGYDIVPFNEPSDIYIINSCTVTSRTDAETRRLIRRARRLSPDSRIIATGCYAQVAPGDLEKMPELDGVIGNNEKQNISAFVESATHSVSDISTINSVGPLKLTTFAEHTRAFLQIQNGCNSFCTYCIVPYARGRSRSVKPEDIMNGIHDLTKSSFKEVVLTGIHLGAYGLDLSTPTDLAALIKKIDHASIVQRLRIGSIEPNEVSDELLSIIADSELICRHLHLPLQSGSDSVLKSMGRHYTSDLFSNLVTRIIKVLPDVFIGVDVIAGFPGESEDDFAATVKLLESLPLADLHVFPYSKRTGTKAAEISGHLPSNIITERAAVLRAIAKKKKEVFLNGFMEIELKVLVQSFNEKTGICKGLSRNYISVSFPGENSFLNKELKVLIKDCDGTACRGEHLG